MAGKKIRISETSCGRSARVRRTPFAIPGTKPPIAVRETATRKSGTPKADSSRGRSCQDAQQEAEIGARGKGKEECSRFREKGGKPKKPGNLAADALSAKAHQSVRNADQDNNSGVEAAHFTEGSAEGAAARVPGSSMVESCGSTKAGAVGEKADKDAVDSIFTERMKSDPQAASNFFSRWRQKQAIKKSMPLRRQVRPLRRTQQLAQPKLRRVLPV